MAEAGSIKSRRPTGMLPEARGSKLVVGSVCGEADGDCLIEVGWVKV